MFIIYKCAGEKYYKDGAKEGIICPVDNSFCPYCGYCSVWKKVRHTGKAQTCTKRERLKQQVSETEQK